MKQVVRAFLKKDRQGFTLIELLIVIAIISVLAVVVVVVLNPVELVKVARDSNRLQHLFIINRALRLQETDRPNPYLGSSSVIYVSVPDDDPACGNLGLPAPTSGWSYACAPSSTYRNDDGTGWVPVQFDTVSFQPLFSTLPIDPLNQTSTGFYYTYTVNGQWELNAQLDSAKYGVEMTKDGGDDDTKLEVGNSLFLMP